MAKEKDKLIGIKAIAAYLDMSVRNVYHWEKKLGLPLHRVSTESGYRIYAVKEEIDKWLKNQSIKSNNKRKNIWILTSILGFIIILCVLFFILLKPSKKYKDTGGGQPPR